MSEIDAISTAHTDPAPDGADNGSDFITRETPPTCTCGALRNPSNPKRCLSGHPWLGHGGELSRQTGIYAAPGAPEMAAIEDAARALVEQSIADAGGRSELGARALTQHENRGIVQERIWKLTHALRTKGDIDPRRNRLREGWIKRLESLISTAIGIDRALGLERKAKHVESATDIIAEYRRRESRS